MSADLASTPHNSNPTDTPDDSAALPSIPPAHRGLPLYVRILIGALAGVGVGTALGPRAAPLGEAGMLAIQLLKALATPLIFLAIIDAFLRTRIPARKGATLLALSALNALVAIAIGLTVANVLHSGTRWQGHTGDYARQLAPISAPVTTAAVPAPAASVPSPPHAAPAPDDPLTAPARAAAAGSSLAELTLGPPPAASPPATTSPVNPASIGSNAPAAAKKPGEEAKPPTLNPLENLARYVPESFLKPFVENSLISVVLLAVLLGVALRRVGDRAEVQKDTETLAGVAALHGALRALLAAFGLMLGWIIQIIPFAVFGIVARVVGQTGAQVFGILGVFLLTVLFGLFLHAVVYYGLLLRVVGRMSPRRFYAGALDAIVTALSCGSSLATLPVTLRCLDANLHVSPDSARLAACVGTNLNHDGIILYEAVTALFVAQAFGYHLGPAQQITIALASVMAGIGIAGIPEAGLITLPLVLSAAGLPAPLVATIIPLILPVDWIIGRCRAATNVLSDMTVAVLLDRLHPDDSDKPDKPDTPATNAVQTRP